MKIIFLSILLIFFFISVQTVRAQLQALPEGAKTNWVIDEPEEIVTYMIFDPTTVKEKLPLSLRFITINELAGSNINWAMEHLNNYPAHKNWGISFIEIVKMKTFKIDGHSPKWPKNGAVGLWFARVAPADSSIDLGPGKPFLALDFWMPDSNYVVYMNKKGHYASYGDVHLSKNSKGVWIGSIKIDGLNVVCECEPKKNVVSSGSRGMQIIFPPALSKVKSIVRVAFVGHQEQLCEKDSWKLSGSHPMVLGKIMSTTSFQFGYNLIGGAYNP
ncbi:MAG: hypothetical protein V1773_11365 [bacterium]